MMILWKIAKNFEQENVIHANIIMGKMAKNQKKKPTHGLSEAVKFGALPLYGVERENA